MLNHAWMEDIIEDNLTVLDPILEMNVLRSKLCVIGQFRQRKIVRRDDPDRPGIHKTTQDGFGADRSIVIVRAAQHFVE